LTKPTITCGHGFCDDCSKLTGLTYGDWTETDTGNLLTPTVTFDDYFHLTRAAGASEAYLSYPSEAGADNLGLSSTVYTVIYYRYQTSNLDVKAKIVLIFSDATTQTILDETSSTTMKTGFTYITTGKTIDHIRLYANAAVGTVVYDFVLICKSIFTFPNTQYGSEFNPPPRYAMIPIPSRVSDVTQNLGSESATWTASCNLDKGSWKRSGDYVNGEVFMDIAHNSYQEPFQWLDTGKEQFKVTLDTLRFPEHSDSHTLDLTFKEYSRSSKSNESYVERFGLNL
jgi:hypothetical protein